MTVSAPFFVAVVSLTSFLATLVPTNAPINTPANTLVNTPAAAVNRDNQPGNPLIEPLAPLSFLVGKCWAGTFPDSDVRDVHCYETGFRGTVVIDRQLVEDRPEFCGTTYFHYALPRFEGEEDGVILFRNYNITGGVADGLIEAKGRTLAFPEEVFEDDDGQKFKFRTRIRPKSSSSYEVITQQQKGGVWSTQSRILYKEIGSAAYPFPEGYDACAQ